MKQLGNGKWFKGYALFDEIQGTLKVMPGKF